MEKYFVKLIYEWYCIVITYALLLVKKNLFEWRNFFYKTSVKLKPVCWMMVSRKIDNFDFTACGKVLKNAITRKYSWNQLFSN